MNTKTCKRCGWVYPITQPGTKCLICSEPFDIMACPACGQLFSRVNYRGTVCPACAREADRKWYINKMDGMHKRFERWLAKVKQVPKDYPTLTEAQWLEACRHFNGCARCDSDEIDTRGFFVGRDLGGRYCDWNVIPLCTRCASMWRLDANMFKSAYMRDRIKSDKRTRYKGASDNKAEFRDSLDRLIEYLEVRLDNAIRVPDDTNGTAG